MRLLQLIPSLDPRGGGTVEAVRLLSQQLQAQGHEVEIACLDAPGAPAPHGPALTVHALGPVRPGYGYRRALVPWLRAAAGRYDAVLVHGLWQYCGLAAWRALAGGATPYYVYAHGMLDPWFKRRYRLKHLKKWLYWPWAEYRVLRDARAVLFTCAEERRLARQSFWLYRCRELVCTLGIAPPPPLAPARAAFLAAHPQLHGRRLLLFLGRLHEKKGVDLLIDAFGAVAARDPQLHLVMAGPAPTAQLQRWRQRCAALGLDARVSWTGMLDGELKWGAFAAADLFVLPSHQENFGLAVAEALACGTPVLISDRVNIWREIDAAHAGLVGADTLAGTLDGLQRWLALAPPARQAMALAARQCYAHHFAIAAVARALAGQLARDQRGGALAEPA